MNPTTVTIQLDSMHRVYHPGEKLSGRFRWDVPSTDDVKRVELSVMWRTEGKGDEDFGLHHFESHELLHASSQLGGKRGARERVSWRRFQTEQGLPNSPTSYHGLLVKIRWCVRVRCFLKSGKEVVEDREFQLGGTSNVGEPKQS